MNKATVTYIAIAVSIIQLGVPASMIAKREITLRAGRQFKFRTAPVDPYDAFRGRYVALRMTETRAPAAKDTKFERGQKVFVALSEDTNGFAVLSHALRERPRDGAYIKTRARSGSRGGVRVNLPFDRYYMNEKDAPAAEAAYRQQSRGTNRTAYVTVRVSRGFAVLEELYVDDVPIEEYIQQSPV